MKKVLLLLVVVCAVGNLFLSSAAFAEREGKPLAVAVLGDWPYGGPAQAATTGDLRKDNAPPLLNSVNSDSDVSLVIHVGDIHSGSMPCTGTGLSPIPAGSDPSWNKSVFDIFQKFKRPVVYTPGDNEWTDCHKSKEFRSGAPMNELAAVRSLFFPKPGYTIGGVRKEVTSQAQEAEDNPADAQFVENVLWKQSEVVFVTLNVPGSNNDGLPWSGIFNNEGARQQEVIDRNAANLRWLERAFKKGKNAAAVVIALQADMWDLSATAVGGDGLNGYDAFIQALANHAIAFGRPVLLLNGDSHAYGVDRPLDPTDRTGCQDTTGTTGCTGGAILSTIHPAPAVSNLTRITVQGSTNKPYEWLKLKIDPSTPTVFTWENVVYCPQACPVLP